MEKIENNSPSDEEVIMDLARQEKDLENDAEKDLNNQSLLSEAIQTELIINSENTNGSNNNNKIDKKDAAGQFEKLTISKKGNLSPSTHTEQQRQRAIGLNSALKGDKKYLQLHDEFFPPMRLEKGNWLAENKENAQPFSVFKKKNAIVPNPTKNIIYVLPLGDFPPNSSPDLSIVQHFTTCYFHPLKVVFLTPAKELDRTGEHLTFQVQSVKESTAPRTYKVKIEYKAEKVMFLTGDVKDVLLKEKIHLPNPLFVTAITLCGLFTDSKASKYRYLLGEASIGRGVGVFRCAGYNSAQAVHYPNKLLRRACQVLAHEISHLFGLEHCTYHACGMNGAVDIQENDTLPIHLCPICLHKLVYATGSGVFERYEKLLEFYGQWPAFKEEFDWLTRRLKYVHNNKDY